MTPVAFRHARGEIIRRLRHKVDFLVLLASPYTQVTNMSSTLSLEKKIMDLPHPDYISSELGLSLDPNCDGK